MERFEWAELGSTKPAILIKSLGKYFLVQVKEFPAGQANDKVYEEGGNSVLKTELASFRLRHAWVFCPVPENRWSFLPDTTTLDIRCHNFQSDYNDRLVDSGLLGMAWPHRSSNNIMLCTLVILVAVSHSMNINEVDNHKAVSCLTTLVQNTTAKALCAAKQD